MLTTLFPDKGTLSEKQSESYKEVGFQGNLGSLVDNGFREEAKEEEKPDMPKVSSKSLCTPDMTFEDCELLILRTAVDKTTTKQARRIVRNPDIQPMLALVCTFLHDRKLICYGGTAINNLLPAKDQFYDKTLELPDYDVYSKHAMDDAKALADLFLCHGYTEVVAKAGQHHGTFKVFVNFLGIVDITHTPAEIFDTLANDSIYVRGLWYCPINFLRMAMYTELSRPAGDTSRWEKVMKRLTLLNKHYPLQEDCGVHNTFQRALDEPSEDMEGTLGSLGPSSSSSSSSSRKTTKNRNKGTKKTEKEKDSHPVPEKTIHVLLRNLFAAEECVFFGGFALSLFWRHMPPAKRPLENKTAADFDILSNTPFDTATHAQTALVRAGVTGVSIVRHPPIGELILEHYEIVVWGNNTVAFVYQPNGCHSYNVVRAKQHKLRIASIDTMLSFYLAFLYTNRPYYTQFLNRITCMAAFLFEVQQQNRLKQTGLLKRFSITCYGHQPTREDMRAQKAHMYRQLKRRPGTREYQEWFLNYTPAQCTQRRKQQSQLQTKPSLQKTSFAQTTHTNKTQTKRKQKAQTTRKQKAQTTRKQKAQTKRKANKR